MPFHAAFNKDYKKLENEILRWWKGFHPISYTHKQHIENPTINTSSRWHSRLARLAGKIAKKRMEK